MQIRSKKSRLQPLAICIKQEMDLLTRESEKLALLQERILLLPNSLAVKAVPDQAQTSLQATHKLELLMKYALAEVKILVSLTKPLDFTILTPALLPNASILGLVEVESNTRLVDLVKMLVNAMQKHHTSLLEGTLLEYVPKSIAALSDMYPLMRHELAVMEETLTVILCFKPQEKISICSVNNLVKADKLINTADHCFNIKMEFDAADGRGIFKPGGFGVQWSPDLAAMLPELADVRLPALKSESLTEFVVASKDALEEKLQEAVTAWEERSMVMLKLVDTFADVGGVAVNLNFDTMTGLDIVFRTRSKSHVYTVSLYTGNRRGDCKVAFKSQLESGKIHEFKPWEKKAKELEEMDLGKNLVSRMRQDIAEDLN